jgi:DNA-binding transcriptional regulator YiaG
VTNHQNRGPKGPASNPSPEQVRAAREAAGLTQTAASAVIYCSLRAWQDWESGARRMHPAFWELWQAKVSRVAT